MALPTPLGVGRRAVILFQEWALTSVGSLSLQGRTSALREDKAHKAASHQKARL